MSGSAPYMIGLEGHLKSKEQVKNMEKMFLQCTEFCPCCGLRTPPGQEALADLAKFAGQSTIVHLLSQSPLSIQMEGPC
jgi:hypothetical protein